MRNEMLLSTERVPQALLIVPLVFDKEAKVK
jgi:hypothetical protein